MYPTTYEFRIDHNTGRTSASADMAHGNVFMEEWFGRSLGDFAAGMERRGYGRKWSETTDIQCPGYRVHYTSHYWEICS